MEHSKRKYHNVPDSRRINGRVIKFDSKKEAARYAALRMMLKAGVIRNLQLQPEYTIIGAFRTADGEDVRAERYRADFRYQIAHKEPITMSDGTTAYKTTWETIIEDVKSEGTKTALYLSKRKALLAQGIEIREV